MTRKWTFMVYMAGDNGKVFEDGHQLFYDLQQYGWSNIAAMAKVGSSPEVAVVVQYDTLDGRQFTPRFYIDQSSSTGRLIEKIPPVNTGDPRNLTDFIVWAITTYPAEKYALVLWNHGTGWKEDDIYTHYRIADRTPKRNDLRGGTRGSRMLRRALFIQTIENILSIEDDEIRGICYDDSSMSFLDNGAIFKALDDAKKVTNQRLSLLGMDACLMNMIEVAYELHQHADCMVGSQEVELAEGWPYSNILQGLVNNPEMSACDLGKLVVDKFGDYYASRERGMGISTQSAIDLKRIPNTYDKITALANSLAGGYASDLYTEIALDRAKKSAQTFTDQDYLDLSHFAQWLMCEYTGNRDVKRLADNLVTHLDMVKPGSPIVANFRGSQRPNANGLSVYFPRSGYSPFYNRQKFVRSEWGRVIRLANRVEHR